MYEISLLKWLKKEVKLYHKTTEMKQVMSDVLLGNDKRPSNCCRNFCNFKKSI